jgi:hypothetical protein
VCPPIKPRRSLGPKKRKTKDRMYIHVYPCIRSHVYPQKKITELLTTAEWWILLKFFSKSMKINTFSTCYLENKDIKED